ncbi:MAG: acylphosphatase [Planctomycetaceae bacterium]|jgi:acylphosphatase
MCDQPTKRRVFYSGRVQGVGFRWTVEKFTRQLPVTGFVRNLSDGRVELVASANVETLDLLQAQIARHFEANITAADSESFESPEAFSDFRIRS